MTIIPVALLGPWSALTVAEVNALFRKASFRWWIAGGWAIDLFIGRQTRPHHDIEVAILRRDTPALHRWLARWQVWYVPRVGQGLRSWPIGEPLPAEAHEIWARRTPDGPWELEVLIEEADADRWIYRRDARVSLPLADYGTTVNGIPVVRPEIALLYKSKSSRDHDHADLSSVLPLLDAAARDWLINTLRTTGTGADWLSLLR